MKVLITGAKGQLGKAFQELFEKENVNCLLTDKKLLDITNFKLTRKFIEEKNKDITHIINCAAYNDVDKAEKDWKQAFNVNGLGVRNLALCANNIEAELVHYSTDYVFSGEKFKYNISDTPNPVNKYGESKVLGENFLSVAKKSYLIRVSWVFGDGEQNFPIKLINWSKKNNQLKIITDEVSSPTYTIDLAEATLELIKLKAQGKYHITNSSCSRYNWAKYILNKIGWKGELLKAKQADFKTEAKRPKSSILDNFGYFETTGNQLRDWKEVTNDFLRKKGII